MQEKVKYNWSRHCHGSVLICTIGSCSDMLTICFFDEWWKCTSIIWIIDFFKLYYFLGWIQCVKGLEEHLNCYPCSRSLLNLKSIHCILKAKSVVTCKSCPDGQTIWCLICWGRLEAWGSPFSRVDQNPSSMASRWVWMSNWKDEMMLKDDKLYTIKWDIFNMMCILVFGLEKMIM